MATKPAFKTKPKFVINRKGEAEGTDVLPDPPAQSKDARRQYRVIPDPRDEFAELRSSLRIDKHQLDDECMRQPVLYQEISEQHVFANSERDSAKEDLAAIDAKLADKIRTKWNAAGEKFSETRVGDAVQSEQAHIDAYNHWSALARRASYLGTLVASADQRGKMLRELGSLFVTGYFDRVVSGRGKRDADAGMAEAGREGMRQARMRRAGSTN